MPLTVTVTPQETWPDASKITLARMRKTAKPTVNITGSVSSSDLAAEAVTAAKLKHDAFFYAAEAAPGADAITITLSPAPAALVDGLMVIFKAASNKGANPTLNVNGLGAKKIYQAGTLQPAVNALRANQVYKVIYNSSLDSSSGGWELQGPDSNLNDQYAATAGTGDAYTVTLTPAPIAYYAGLQVRFKTDRTNTGASTLNVNSLGAKSIRKCGDTNLAAGDLLNGAVYEAIYDGTNFQLLTPARNNTEDYAADAGSTDTYVITLDPEATAYVAGMVVRFKANTANTGAATLNVNGLGAKTIKKRVNVDLSDNDIKAGQIVEVIYDGTNFQLIGEPASQFTSANQTIPAAGGEVTALNHGLGSMPSFVRWVIVCLVTESGYAVGDEIPVTTISNDDGNSLFLEWTTATQLGLRRNSPGGAYIANKSGAHVWSNIGGANFATNWALKAYARL